MAITKFVNEIVVQEYTCNGWEDSCSELNWKAARATKKEYIENGVSAQIIERKILNVDALYVPVLEYCREFYKSKQTWPEAMEFKTTTGKVKFKLSEKEMRKVLGYNANRLVEG